MTFKEIYKQAPFKDRLAYWKMKISGEYTLKMLTVLPNEERRGLEHKAARIAYLKYKNTWNVFEATLYKDRVYKNLCAKRMKDLNISPEEAIAYYVNTHQDYAIINTSLLSLVFEKTAVKNKSFNPAMCTKAKVCHPQLMLSSDADAITSFVTDVEGLGEEAVKRTVIALVTLCDNSPADLFQYVPEKEKGYAAVEDALNMETASEIIKGVCMAQVCDYNDLRQSMAGWEGFDVSLDGTLEYKRLAECLPDNFENYWEQNS